MGGQTVSTKGYKIARPHPPGIVGEAPKIEEMKSLQDTTPWYIASSQYERNFTAGVSKQMRPHPVGTESEASAGRKETTCLTH